MTSTLIENLVERVSQNNTVLPNILFDEIANTLNKRFHNYHVIDSLEEIDWAFCSEHFMYESFMERVTVEEKPKMKPSVAIRKNGTFKIIGNKVKIIFKAK